MESVLAQVSRKERWRLDVVPIDVDEHAELARRLGVSAAPALVLIADKRVAGRLDGRSSATKIEALLDAQLGSPVAA